MVIVSAMTTQGALEMEVYKATEFKAKCLKIMDEVAESGERVLITKHGKPVAELVPIREKPKSLYGVHKDNIKIIGDIISPIDVEWEDLK